MDCFKTRAPVNMSARCAGQLATSMRDHVAICFENFSRLRSSWAAPLAFAFASCVVGCSPGNGDDPIRTLSDEVALDGERPATVVHALQRGVYLIEARERDIDVRVTVEANGVS